MRIFISYAREDSKHSKQLYEILSGYPEAEVWLDSESLLPGADWKYEITQAIERADVIILLLSENSVNKTGYVQREMRHAVDRLTYLPPGDRLVIPVRITSCRPRHPALLDLNWVDLFPQWQPGLGKLLAGIGLDPAFKAPAAFTHQFTVRGTSKYDGTSLLLKIDDEVPAEIASEVVVPPILVRPGELPVMDESMVYDRGLEHSTGSEYAFLRVWTMVGERLDTYYRKQDWGLLREALVTNQRTQHDRMLIVDSVRRLWAMTRELLPEVEEQWRAIHTVTFAQRSLPRRTPASSVSMPASAVRSDPLSRAVADLLVAPYPPASLHDLSAAFEIICSEFPSMYVLSAKEWIAPADFDWLASVLTAQSGDDADRIMATHLLIQLARQWIKDRQDSLTVNKSPTDASDNG